MEWIKAGGSSENIKSAAALRTSTAQPVHLKDAAVFNLAEYAANYQGASCSLGFTPSLFYLILKFVLHRPRESAASAIHRTLLP